jgi:uncharacterized membrane protein YfcA
MTLFLLLLAAFAGGAANALAGGGMFVVFPALLLAGVASVKANATASLVMPGAFAATWVYRRTLGGVSRGLLTRLLIVSLAGSAVGSVLLLSTSNGKFSNLVPWMRGFAAIAFSLA